MFTNLNDEPNLTNTTINTTDTTSNTNTTPLASPPTQKQLTRVENTLYTSKCLFGSRYYDLQLIERINNNKESIVDYIQLRPLEKVDGSSLTLRLDSLLCVNHFLKKDLRRYFRFKERQQITFLQRKQNEIDYSHFTILYSYTVVKVLQWRVKSYVLRFENEEIRRRFEETIEKRLLNFLNRPKSLLIFINPISGARKALSYYVRYVEPIFNLAGIKCDVRVTERAEEAFDTVQECDLSGFDGVISVGGDGLFAEILKSLLIRTQIENKIDHNDSSSEFVSPNKIIGIIPAGSTDAVAYCTTGLNDVITSALQIAFGSRMNIDVITVHNEHKFLNFCTTLLGYGYFGDIIRDSLNLRCCGPFRYNLTGALNVIRNNSYSGSIKIKQDKNLTTSPFDRTLCVTNCKICANSLKLRQNLKAPLQAPSIGTKKDQPNHAFERDDSKELPNTNNVINVNDGDENDDENSTYTRFDSSFMSMNLVNMTCRCAKSKFGMSPSCHSGNGYADLIIVKKTSRINFLNFLVKIASNGLKALTELPFVQVFRTNEFEFVVNGGGGGGGDSWEENASSSKKSNWNCDGEIMNSFKVKAKVRQQLLPIYANGLDLGINRLR